MTLFEAHKIHYMVVFSNILANHRKINYQRLRCFEGPSSSIHNQIHSSLLAIIFSSHCDLLPRLHLIIIFIISFYVTIFYRIEQNVMFIEILINGAIFELDKSKLVHLIFIVFYKWFVCLVNASRLYSCCQSKQI